MSTDYLLADIGGTQARIATYDGDKIGKPIILQITDFDCPVSLFKHAADKLNVSKPKLVIASTGVKVSETEWHSKGWTINKDDFVKSNIELELVVNDFYASSYGVLTLGHDDVEILISGEAKPYSSKMICGPGTGIGLAYADYIQELESYRVRETFGGFFPVVSQTEEQNLCLRTIKSLKSDHGDYPLAFEDVCSGRGLPYLHRAICRMHGAKEDEKISNEILSYPDAPLFKETVRIFQEFLGSFLQTAAIAGHSLGGIYLDGGVIQTLSSKNLLDTSYIKKTFHACQRPIVRDNLINIPLKRVDTNHVALSGLKVILEQEVKA